MDTIMVSIANYFVFIIVIIFAVYFLMQKRSKQKSIVFISVISMFLALIIAKVSGSIYYDPRPFVTQHLVPLIAPSVDNGFPSDQALLSFTIAAIAFVFDKRLGILLIFLGFLVSLARIYVHVHSWVDILGSFIISLFSVLIAWYLRKNFIRI